MTYFLAVCFSLALIAVMLSIVATVYECKHNNQTWPQNGRQTCNDCGSYRFYRIGYKPSKWYRKVKP